MLASPFFMLSRTAECDYAAAADYSRLSIKKGDASINPGVALLSPLSRYCRTGDNRQRRIGQLSLRFIAKPHQRQLLSIVAVDQPDAARQNVIMPPQLIIRGSA
jgi:hypothetical protein